ncbi:hypothetical protein C8A05DRAFT_29953 [Staphylotrichum tortipilum]|uniref:Uncharacterized protein n=1 Tax=Staphylotrichum tortipilum TaxID=2831512 RepID=A0AAN6RXK8_9PEZI|nr:hypothetical protein C8A05DRAFT_29953 [Staphylotrichum longicolle]
MSRRAWPNPDGPTGRPIGIVNPINAPETGTEIWVQETPLPLVTLSRFVEFLGNHRLPNGRTTTIPTLSSDEFGKFMRPYNDWAPAPYNNNRIRSDSAMNRFSVSFTGLEEMFDFQALLSGRGPQTIDFELEICRQRLWTGMVPLSDHRWAEKKLDAPENIDLAVEHILKTADMIYFSLPDTSRRMRQAYNKAYDTFAHFDTVLDAYYARATPSTPRPSPVARLADLWAEFFFSHIHFVTNRVHTWAASHVDRLADGLATRLEAAPTVPRATSMSPQQEVLFTQYQNLAHIIRRVDETVLFPLVGFKNTLPHWRHAASPPIVDWPAYIRSHGATPLQGNYPADVLQRNEVYHQRVANLVREKITRHRGAGAGPARGNVGAFSNEEVAAPIRGVRAAYAQGRRELRGEAEAVVEELWVAALRQSLERPEDGGAARPPRYYAKWGFLGYRVWHGHSDEEWAAFVRKFETDVRNWGAGVAGVEGVKGKMEIRWVDGRELGIAEGDVEGARKHFKGLHENDEAGLEGLNAPAFLVADKSSIDSYLHDVELPAQSFIDKADASPFILVGAKDAVEADRGNSAGFDGTVRVLGSVLLDDVWPCLRWRHVQVKDMWNLAALHPSGVGNLPTVVKLEGHENFSQWKERLRSHCSVNHLTKFIDHTAKAPKAPASRRKIARYHRKRAIAYAIILESVEPIIDVLKCHGWVDGKDDPQGLYDLTLETVALFQDRAIKKGWRMNLRSTLALMERLFPDPDADADFGRDFYAATARLIETGTVLSPKEVNGLPTRLDLPP